MVKNNGMVLYLYPYYFFLYVTIICGSEISSSRKYCQDRIREVVKFDVASSRLHLG